MSFKGINLSEAMIKSLNRQGFANPSEIQLRAIPKALKGETLMVQSATGTGKTLAFLVPLIEKVDFLNQNIQLAELKTLMFCRFPWRIEPLKSRLLRLLELLLIGSQKD